MYPLLELEPSRKRIFASPFNVEPPADEITLLSAAFDIVGAGPVGPVDPVAPWDPVGPVAP